MRAPGAAGDARAAALRARREVNLDDGGPEGAVLCGWTDEEGWAAGTEPESICDADALYSLRLPDAFVPPKDRAYLTPWTALCARHTAAARLYWPDVVRVRDVRRPGEVLP